MPRLRCRSGGGFQLPLTAAWPVVSAPQPATEPKTMHRYDYRDIIGGAILAAGGLFYGIYAQTHYQLGTLSQMDSGMFPMWLGYVLAGFGVLIVVMALARRGEFTFPTVDWWTLGVVIVSVAVFAFSVRRLGAIPAIVLQVLIVTFADNRLSTLGKLALTVALVAMAYLIFIVALQLPLRLFHWPF